MIVAVVAQERTTGQWGAWLGTSLEGVRDDIERSWLDFDPATAQVVPAAFVESEDFYTEGAEAVANGRPSFYLGIVAGYNAHHEPAAK